MGQLVPYSQEDKKKLDKLSDDVGYVVDIKNFDMRTLQQNKALWKWCEMIALSLNEQGFSVNKTLKAEVEWTKDSVKAIILNPIIKTLYNITTSTQLNKKDFDKLIDNIINIFAQRKIIIPQFPTQEYKE